MRFLFSDLSLNFCSFQVRSVLDSLQMFLEKKNDLRSYFRYDSIVLSIDYDDLEN